MDSKFSISNERFPPPPLPSNEISNKNIQSKKVINFGYRFLPQQINFLFYNLEISDKHMEILELVGKCASSYFKKTLLHSGKTWVGFNYGSMGMSSCLMNTDTHVVDTLFEAVTYYDGNYTRLLILASIRFGCTIWYRTAPVNPDTCPDLPEIPDYNLFHNMEYTPPDYIKYSLIEINNVCKLVDSTLKLFNDISIPGDDVSPMFKSVNLCLILSILHSVGIFPPS